CIVRGGTSGTARFPSAEWWSGSTPVFPGEDSNLAETVKNATTSISFLSFSTLRTSHGGEYTCRGRVLLVTAEVIAASSPVDVVVRLPAPTVTVSVSSGALNEGTSLTLTCTATLPPWVDTDVNVTINWTADISNE
ncbi:hypothetical protein GBAR_LOCUS1907, partial [Geodia barretti]